jgi:hypothetical protein
MNRFIAFRTSIILVIILFTILISSCDGDKFQKMSMDGFKGTWELQGRSMFEGVTIQIDRNKQGEFKGEVISINDHKLVKMFAEPGDIWVSVISRVSNYEFKLVEKKIGSALFSVYGLDTSKEFKVQFIDENTIGLSGAGGNPKSSVVRYVRVKTDE